MEIFLTIKLCTYAKLSIELIIYIKIDLALNIQQKLICHKTKQAKPNITHLLNNTLYSAKH